EGNAVPGRTNAPENLSWAESLASRQRANPPGGPEDTRDGQNRQTNLVYRDFRAGSTGGGVPPSMTLPCTGSEAPTPDELGISKLDIRSSGINRGDDALAPAMAVIEIDGEVRGG